ncbi:MAG: M23 family peptidase [Meiothermus sp.]
MGLKPGWYVLGAVLLYALAMTLAWSAERRQVAALQAEVAKARDSARRGPEGLMLPLVGACLPKDPDNLPGAPRPYRRGVNQGFVFTDGASCVPVVYGTGVVAAGGGEVVRLERDYQEPTPAEFEALLKAVEGGATPAQLDRLRGREIWIRHPDGSTTVYAHLSEVAPGLEVGSKVTKGQFIGKVGNSGTSAGVRGSRAGARLLFELWTGTPGESRFFGQGVERREILLNQAKQRFGLP